MDYNDYAEELQKRIASFDTYRQQLQKAYENSIKQNAESYNDTLAYLAKSRTAAANAAAADSALARQSADVVLAQRGLSNSGETAQSEINRSLSLGKELSDIDRDYESQALKARQAQQASDAEAAETLAKGSVDLQQELTEATESLAKAEQAEAAEKEAKSAEIAKAEESAHDKALMDKTTAADSYTPKMTAATMAKNILSSISDTGVIKTELQNASAFLLLEDMQNEYGITADYINDVKLTLKSKGYKDTTRPAAEAITVSNYAKQQMNNWTSAAYKADKTSQTTDERFDAASKSGAEKQKEYVYTHCTSLSAVKQAFAILGFTSDEYNAFITQAEKDKKLTLGMDA